MAMISKSPTNKSGNPPTNVSIRFRVYSPPYNTEGMQDGIFLRILNSGVQPFLEYFVRLVTVIFLCL